MIRRMSEEHYKISNQKAYYDYEFLDKFEAGINLMGAEVKAVRLGHVDMAGSFVRIKGSEAYLFNVKIFPYKYARPEGYDEKRTRKLLLHKKEIVALKSKTEASGLTIVPISMYTTHSFIKVELAIGKAKKQFDKRASIKKRDQDRDMEQALKDSRVR